MGDASKLYLRLAAEGIPVETVRFIGGVASVVYRPEATAQQIIDGDAIAAAYNQAAEDALDAADAAKQEAAKIGAHAIPNWATWTEAEALAWFDDRLSDADVDAIGSLAAAKPVMKDQNTVIRALVRMVVALRDKSWPDLDRFTP